jgi:hypothetical protein
LVRHPAVFVVDTAADVFEQLEEITAVDDSLRRQLAPAVSGTAW